MMKILPLQADKYTKGSAAKPDRIYAQLGKRMGTILVTRLTDQNTIQSRVRQ
jgi:hypothetical protein